MQPDTRPYAQSSIPTTTYEAYIPCTRHELVELCLAEGKLTEAEGARFRAFCELLATYFHFRFHASLESMKAAYAPMNPDEEEATAANAAAAHKAEAGLIKTLREILERGNYREVSRDELRESMQKYSLVDVRTAIDFDDIAQATLYVRGQRRMMGTRRLPFWRSQEVEIDVFEQVVLAIRFQDAIHFLASKRKPGREPSGRGFTPGQLYLYVYKNIPRNDLELLFPNVQLRMNWFDQLLFLGSAAGAGVSMIVKALPNLLLIGAALLLLTVGPERARQVGVDENSVRDFMPTLAALASLALALGGFAWKQYSSYQGKRLKFLKSVTETLFFKNLATNASALHVLVDAAEEEETKEIILIYYHLLTAEEPLTPEQLDERIETWLEQRLGVQVNFDMDRTRADLCALEGEARLNALDAPRTVSLLSLDEQGCCRALPLDAAKQVIDYRWDQAFQYSGEPVTA